MNKLRKAIRRRTLDACLDYIVHATEEEKRHLFKRVYRLEEYQKEFEEKEDNRFDSHADRAYHAMNKVINFTRMITGYNCCWVRDTFEEYSAKGFTGRKVKYDKDMRDLYCKMITLMVNRGSSETQAMRFIMKVTGDKAMSEGYLRELRDSYRNYKKLGLHIYEGNTLDFLEEAYCIGDALSWDINEATLTDNEKAYSKAVDAFRKVYQDSIDYMKKYHPILKKYDNCYPEIFGCMIDVVAENYDDPLDYFFNNKKYQEINHIYRRKCLMEFLQAVHHFWEQKHGY